MKIDALITIHEILKEQAEIKRKAAHKLYIARNEAEDKGADNYESLVQLYNKAREDMLRTTEALDAFEQHEW